MSYWFTTSPAAYVDLGRTVSVTANDLTVAAWVRLASATGATRRVVNQKNNGIANSHFALGMTTGEKAIFSRTPSGTSATGYAATSARTLDPGRWYHLVGRQRGTEQSIWIDGVLDGSNTIGTGLTWAADGAVNAFISRFAAGTEQNMAGAIGFVAAWGGLGLGDDEIWKLAQGCPPWLLPGRNPALVLAHSLRNGPHEPFLFGHGASVTSAAPVGLEPPVVLPGLRRRGRALLGALVDAAATFAVDSLGTLVETLAIPLSFATLMAVDAAARPDWRAVVDGGHRLALDWPASVAADRGARVAWLATGGAVAGAPVEWGGAILVAADAAAPVEMLATLAREEPARIAFAGAVAMDARVPFATGRLVGADAGAAIDWLRSVGIDAATHPEWSVGLVINADTLAPVEWDGQAAFVADARLFIVERRSVVFQVEARSVVFRIEKQ